MKTISTFNALHLGDNLVHLHFLRKLAQAYPEINFTHGAPEQHLAQLHPLAADLPNLELTNIGITALGAINAWCGAGSWWYQQPTTQDWCGTYIRWLDHLARLMGLDNPIRETRDLLFDYPKLQDSPFYSYLRWDFLVVNAQPMSGQWHGYSREGFDQLVANLRSAGKSVLTTEQLRVEGQSITDVGRVSQIANCIIGCVTGPMWPCLNVWNSALSAPPREPVFRIHLQDREHVNMAPNTTHANCLSLVPEILKDRGLI
jgi:hypothetical protein